MNTFHARQRKPAWLIIGKLIGLAIMIPIGFLLILPSIPLPFGQALMVALVLMTAYVTFAYFVRPEANLDNLGVGGGAMNDPTKASDNLNRMLWKAHCLLGPGRFVAGAVLDLVTLVGLVPEVSEEEYQARQMAKSEAKRRKVAEQREAEILARVEARTQQLGGGAIELDSAKYLQPDNDDDAMMTPTAEAC